MAYENLGRTARDVHFEISYNDKAWDPRGRATVDGKLPAPGKIGIAQLGFIGGMGGEAGRMNLIDDDIRESDENNNDAEYSLNWSSFSDLPTCESLKSVKR